MAFQTQGFKQVFIGERRLAALAASAAQSLLVLPDLAHRIEVLSQNAEALRNIDPGQSQAFFAEVEASRQRYMCLVHALVDADFLKVASKPEP